MISDITEYITENGSQILSQIGAHTAISLFSLAVAALVGIPLGYLASKSEKTEAIMSAPFEMLRVVPSLALLILLIPVMGTGTGPAVVALTVLAVPPILLNTIVGFRSVPDFMTESAAGIGMTEKEILRKVRIPAALPMIFAGVRTALVEVVASTTLAAKIGAGGLGEIIFTGLGMNRMDLLILGGVRTAVRSLGAGVIFDAVSKRVMRYKYV